MHGHLPLIALRRAGMKPPAVWIDADGIDPLARDWQHWAKAAHVNLDPTDSVALLDLRFCVGMQVHVMGHGRRRCGALHRRCMDAGAAVVITTVHADDDTAELVLVGNRTVFESEPA